MAPGFWKKANWPDSARRVTLAAQNALELISVGRLSEPYRAEYDVLHSDHRYSLRRYRGTLAANKKVSSPLLLIPPLMLTAEIYDISAELSAATTLVREGIDVWVVDFRAPEKEEGGLGRTLDDHVSAVGDAIERIRNLVRRDVHLAGYSQGGMFAYQCAAYRKGEGLASVISFGSPVDIHRTVPNFSDHFAERLTASMRTILGGPLAKVEGLPGFLTSTGFKLLGVRKEFGQLADFLAKLHDRQALEKREAKRLFLRGDGFVAWPGPAFRTFVDEFIVANRMATGGFVIGGRTVSLADIPCPILCFVGDRDNMASPAAVRAIYDAAPNADISEIVVRAGHFGLVVGSAAMNRTWPGVREWIRWRDGEGPKPSALDEQNSHTGVADFESMEDEALDFDIALDVVGNVAKSAWHRVEEVAESLSDSADHLRYQIPRLRTLRNIEKTSKVSFAATLEEQAREIPDKTFFLWKGRAFSYAESNTRVDNVARGLLACGVLPTQRVGVVMKARPSYLSLVAAINRIGAVAVLVDPAQDSESLRDCLRAGEVAVLVVDPENIGSAKGAFDEELLVLGGGGQDRELGDGVIDLEAIDPAAVSVPSWYEPNASPASALALIIVSTGRRGEAKALRVSNHRWAFSAYGAAAAATLTPKDTVYCCLPLHHAAGTMVSVGAALVGGSRLALTTNFTVDKFWGETRRYGATVVFYAGEMCRALVEAKRSRNERRHSIRLFAGSGMRKELWESLVERLGPVGVLEFYAATEARAVLANASGEKVGSVGSLMPGSQSVALLRFSMESGEVLRGAGGFCIPAASNEAGLLVVSLSPEEAAVLAEERVMRDLFSAGDCWYSTENLLRQDEDGDYWFVERVADLIRSESGLRLSLEIEERFHASEKIAGVAVFGQCPDEGEEERLAAAFQLHEGENISASELGELLESLPSRDWPEEIYQVSQLPLSDGFRVQKSALRSSPLSPKRWWSLLSSDEFHYYQEQEE